MNTSTRSTLSSTLGLGITAFTAISAFAFGVTATATLFGFSALVVFGLAAITMLAYAPAPYTDRTFAEPAPVRTQRKVAAIVEFPRTAGMRSAA